MTSSRSALPASPRPDTAARPVSPGELPDASRLLPEQLAVIFDGTCGFCSATARRMASWDWRHAVVWLPGQAEGLAGATGLSQADTSAAAWAITPDGRRLRGAAAMLCAVDALLPAGVPVFSSLYTLPGLRQVSDVLYDWLAANRHRIPGAPACGLNRRLPPLEPGVEAELRRRLAARSSTRRPA
jgi:predicted DCC family thiol-disulfide oxidoreductase YuxK